MNVLREHLRLTLRILKAVLKRMMMNTPSNDYEAILFAALRQILVRWAR